MGFIDPIGCFIIPMKGNHIDPYQEEALGFFKKMSYAEKNKEIQDSHIFALNLIREVCEVETEKFKMWGVYTGMVQSILNWHYFKNDD
jgi:hypothetical protein